MRNLFFYLIGNLIGGLIYAAFVGFDPLRFVVCGIFGTMTSWIIFEFIFSE